MKHKGVVKMKIFEINKEYSGRYVSDWNAVIKIKILKRTAKTITFLEDDEIRTKKIRNDQTSEYIKLGDYSMAPIIRAERVCV